MQIETLMTLDADSFAEFNRRMHTGDPEANAIRDRFLEGVELLGNPEDEIRVRVRGFSIKPNNKMTTVYELEPSIKIYMNRSSQWQTSEKEYTEKISAERIVYNLGNNLLAS